MSDAAEHQDDHADSGSADAGGVDVNPGTALVEIAPGQALVFGDVPDGLDLVPFKLISSADQRAIVSAFAASSSILNVGAQAANALAQAQGLVRLAPETLKALQAGAEPIKSGGYYLGTLRVGNHFSNSVRWLPASAPTMAGVLASVGPAIAMIAIQLQLSEVSSLVRQNMALTESVLKSVRNGQWAELTGLEQAVSKALAEATRVGEVTPLIWENIAGYEAELSKQRDLFRRNTLTHAAELSKLNGHQERRQYIEKNGEAILLDLHCLVVAHKSWFEYQAIRAGRARLNAGNDPADARLLEAIVDSARAEHDKVVDEMATILGSVHRELAILAELPGKRTIPFTGARRSAGEVAKMAQQLVAAVEQISDSIHLEPAPVVRPDVVLVDKDEQLDKDLRILRWHLSGDERLLAICTAHGMMDGALEQFGNKVGRRMDSVAAAVEATLRRQDILEAATTGYEQGDLIVAVTDARVLVANRSEFHTRGVLRRSISNADIRYVRHHTESSGSRGGVDLITKRENFTWRFAARTGSGESIKAVASLMAERMSIPESERIALSFAPPSSAAGAKQLVE
ncbi:hypothetical protein [Leifsonia sp. NCR5]|uniref:hypothetical protein n=1 Tax=Leifsonia sp. NCR5 TaxID=1978342 RepID=UPI00117B8E89|nr:hypothetical protein [Leifsonia sp. NCR5]